MCVCVCVCACVRVCVCVCVCSTNTPPIMIINRIYQNQNLLVAVAFFLPGRAKDLSAPL